jgi:predicted dehydrogenase
MGSQHLRWGILSTANIARKNWQAIRNSGNGTIVAVASRDADNARKFIAGCQAAAPFDPPPRAIGGYEQLLAAPDVDAVYIPLPTGLRKEWIIKAAAAGKHVLSEKPSAVSAADLREILDACRKNKVQYMDGVMYMHSARLASMRATLDDGSTVGRLRRVSSAFSFRAGPDFFTRNVRVSSTLEPFGCLGDLGWYNLRLSLWAANWRLPQAVTGRLIGQAGRTDSPGPVPTEFSGELLFDDGLSAAFYCSFVADLHQWAHLDGEKGNLSLDDFVNPRDGSELVYLARARRIAIPEHAGYHPTAQESRMMRAFAELALGGKPSDFWPDIALKTQQVMDACLRSALAGGKPVTPG